MSANVTTSNHNHYFAWTACYKFQMASLHSHFYLEQIFALLVRNKGLVKLIYLTCVQCPRMSWIGLTATLCEKKLAMLHEKSPVAAARVNSPAACAGKSKRTEGAWGRKCSYDQAASAITFRCSSRCSAGDERDAKICSSEVRQMETLETKQQGIKHNSNSRFNCLERSKISDNIQLLSHQHRSMSICQLN